MLLHDSDCFASHYLVLIFVTIAHHVRGGADLLCYSRASATGGKKRMHERVDPTPFADVNAVLED